MSKKKVNFKPVEISQETLDQLEKLETVKFDQYQELVKSGQVRPKAIQTNKATGEIIQTKIRFRKPVQIYYDPEKQNFVYLNPFYKTLRLCGEWNDKE